MIFVRIDVDGMAVHLLVRTPLDHQINPMNLIRRLQCDALLFDMDGVLVDSRPVVERTWRRWAARHGLDAEQILRLAHGRRTIDTLGQVAPHLAGPDEIAWLDAAELGDYDGLVAVPGAAKLLSALSAIPWAIVTSAGPELARRRLAAAGLPLPSVLLCSDEVVKGKPEPEGYLIAAERLGVTPGRAVVFEDAPAGIAAGREAGCAVVGVATTYPPAQLTGAAFIVPDLTSITLEAAARGWQVFAQVGLGRSAS